MQDVLHYQSILLNTSVWLGHYQHAFDRLKGKNIILITDENLDSHQNAIVRRFPHIVIPAGEDSKSFSRVDKILSQLFDLKADRNTLLIGFGGGVVTDITGFVAGIFKRGLEFVLMPTSLLAMTDAAIGGKNGVNFMGFKNQVGIIKQPLFTWIDTQFLRTLPYMHFLNGLAEVVKSALIFPGKSLQILNDNEEALMKINPLILQAILSESVQNKLKLVEMDEHDKGERRLLNFGHSFGHAVESQEHMLHGLSVSKGMVAAIKLSVAAGYLPVKQAAEIIRLIENLGLPVNFEFKGDYFIYMEQDKKMADGKMNFVFLHAQGDARIHQISMNELKSLAYDARNISI